MVAPTLPSTFLHIIVIVTKEKKLISTGVTFNNITESIPPRRTETNSSSSSYRAVASTGLTSHP
jgi:hypothetical protein